MEQSLEQSIKESKRRWYHPKNYIGAIAGGAYGAVVGYWNPSLVSPLTRSVSDIIFSIPKLDELVEDFYLTSQFSTDLTLIIVGVSLFAPLGLGVEKGIKYGLEGIKYSLRKIKKK